MRFARPAAAFLTLASLLAAQEQTQEQKPYSQGDPDAFLARARSTERPSIVLFNFNRESG